MKTIILSLASLLLLLLACNHHSDPAPAPQPQAGSVLITLSTAGLLAPQPQQSRASTTRPGSPAENYASELTILIFAYRADGSGPLELQQRIPLDPLPADQTKWATNSTLIIGSLPDLKTPKSIYVVASWPTYVASDFVVGTTTELTMRSRLSSLAAPIPIPSKAAPLLMEGHLLNYNFSANALSATVPIVRQVAKLRLNISITDALKADYPDITWGQSSIGGLHTRAVNVPNRSFVAARNPLAAPTTADDALYALFHYPFHLPCTPLTEPQTWLDSTYVFENPVLGNTATTQKQATYLILHLPYSRGGVTYTNNYYKIYINNSAALPAHPYKVERNMIYELNVLIKGFGLSQELAVPDALSTTITVAPWAQADILTKLNDANDNVPGTITVPQWDPTYTDGGNIVVGDDNDAQDDRNTSGGAAIKPWDPNGGPSIGI
ncbi:MAG: hypothetical protein RR066_01455 [Mucinivorans sp.]